MNILYADNHIIVAVKPAGIATEGGTQPGFEDLMRKWASAHYQKKGAVFLRPVHRLDKPVSGILVFAKTSKALRRLQEAFRERKVGKTYFALVEGVLSEPEGILEDVLQKQNFRSVSCQDSHGKKARLSYKTCYEHKGCTFMRISLDTGRYHQIRSQFSLRGHPVVGDHKYGAKRSFPEAGIALHHVEIQFPHPTTGEILTFCSPPAQGLLQFGWHLKQPL